ncbi:kinase-like protein [Ganoderma leucocontextum]|nr:kinase-like protein [Ganoderma leucocontextum]
MDSDRPLTDHHLFFKPGEVFEFGDDEYRIERKLRSRSTSMVWLAAHTNKRDHVQNDQSVVALETFGDLLSMIVSMDANNAALRYVQDLNVRQKEGTPGSQYCDRSLQVHMSAEPRLCIAKEPCGPTLAALQATQPHQSFTLPISKRIVKQTLLALSFIHTTMKRTHMGVNPHNIQVALLGTKEQLTANIRDHLSSNPPEMIYPESVPDHYFVSSKGSRAMMKAQPLPAFGLSPSLDNLEVRLGGCEYATLVKDLQEFASEDETNVMEELHTSFVLSAPEALRGSPRPFSAGVNIWAVGHLYHVRERPGILLTSTTIPAYYTYIVLGELTSLCSPHVLETRLRGFPHINQEMSDGDVQATCAFLSQCFEMNPARRPTAKRLLADEWFSAGTQ